MTRGDFAGLLRRMSKDKITVSTVAIGKDADVQLMVDIAKWGKVARAAGVRIASHFPIAARCAAPVLPITTTGPGARPRAPAAGRASPPTRA